MNWKKLFTPVTIQAGEYIEESGGVRLYSRDRNLYTGNVTDPGGRTCTVQIIDNGSLLPPSLYCNCDEFSEGTRCQHLAAFFSYLDKVEPEADQTPVTSIGKKTGEPEYIDIAEAFPEPEKEEGIPAYQRKYHYFSVGRALRGYHITPEAFASAEEIAGSDELTVGMHVDFMRRGYYNDWNDDIQVFCAEGEYRKKGLDRRRKPPKVKLILKRDELYSYTCGVEGCDLYDPYMDGYYHSAGLRMTPLCKHVTALLIRVDQYLRDHPTVTDSTDITGQKLLGRFVDTAIDLGGERTKNVVLKPRIKATQIQSDSYYSYRWGRGKRTVLTIDFKIGKDRLYLVKSIRELIKAYEKKEVYALGKKSAILFSREDFTDQSKRLFDFLVSYQEEESYRMDLSYGEKLITAKELHLYGKRLDDFFDLMEGREIEIVTAGFSDVRNPVKAVGTDLKLELRATPHSDSEGAFDGITLTGITPSLQEGIKGAYYLSGGMFGRISKENERALRPFIELSDEGLVDFVIGRGSLAQFYYHVLPQIERYVHIQGLDSAEILEYLPPESAFAFYLDADEQDVFCEVRAVYGDYSYSLSDQSEIVDSGNFYRDIDRENQVIATVNGFFPNYDEKSGRFSCGRDPDVVFNIITEGVNSLMKLGEVQTSGQFERLSVRRGWNLSVGVSVKSDLLSLNVLSSDIPMEELSDILSSYRSKRKYHRLKNGDFLSFEDNDSVAALEEMMEDLHLSVREFTDGKMDVPAYRALYLNKMLEEHDEIATERDKNFKSLVKNFKAVKDADIDVPAALKGVLRNYQKEGFRWIITLSGYSFGGILADEMGLGKTLQMISALLYEKERGYDERSLIVCPASLVYNWQSELARFAPQLSIRAVDGAKEQRVDIFDQEGYDVLITSYDLLRRDIALYEGRHFGYMVLDEAQYIKNPKSGISKAVKIVSASHRFALTGTPIENRLSELWSIFDFLMPGFLYDYETFKREYETPIVSQEDKELTKRLSAMSAPFILRRKKETVLKDLPDKIEEVRYTAFDSKQKSIYDSQLIRMKEMIEQTSQDELSKNRMKILADITRLRQICCDPSLIVDGYSGGSAKRELLMELIREASDGGHRMLVFSQFTSMLSMIEEDLKEAGIPYYLITGATPKKTRLALVNDFNSNEVPVFLISLKAGGTGLNLTGADVVIHFDPWWNAAAENQATDRAHRIGQKSTVSVFKLIAKGTIEEKILRMQEEKQNLADEILNGEGTSFFALSKEELLDLLQ